MTSEFAGVFVRMPALVATCAEASLPPVGAAIEVVRMESGARIASWPGGQVDLHSGLGKDVVHGIVERVRPLRSAAPGSAWILYLAG